MFKSTIFVLFAAALAARADISVSTPGDAPQCSNFKFNVGGSTTGARFAYIMKSAEPCGDPVSEEIAVDDSGNFSWTAGTTAGRYVAVVDNNDGTVEGWSASFNVQDSGITNCANAANASPSTTATASQGSTGSSGNNRSGNNSAPVNAAQSTGTNGSQTGGASRSTVGGVTALALVGAVAAVLSI